jgi:hypothetical protein
MSIVRACRHAVITTSMSPHCLVLVRELAGSPTMAAATPGLTFNSNRAKMEHATISVRTGHG